MKLHPIKTEKDFIDFNSVLCSEEDIDSAVFWYKER